MTSNLADMRIWVPAVAKGTLLKPETQRERLRTVSLEAGEDGSGYGLGIFNINGWIGHNGSLPGYKTVAVYLPEKDMTLVVMVNSDVSGENTNLVGSLLTPITQLISQATSTSDRTGADAVSGCPHPMVTEQAICCPGAKWCNFLRASGKQKSRCKFDCKSQFNTGLWRSW